MQTEINYKINFEQLIGQISGVVMQFTNPSLCDLHYHSNNL